MSETTTVKQCCACGKNLNGQKRMKDSQSRYWCMDCGTEDQKKKMMSSGGGNTCGSCGEMFPEHQLSVFGSKKLCAGCIKRKNKGPGMMETITGALGSLRGSGGGGGSANKKKLVAMLAIMGLLAAIAIWTNMK
jgi:hypothetical protein